MPKEMPEKQYTYSDILLKKKERVLFQISDADVISH